MQDFLIAKEVLKKLITNGYQAYFVGGCVRDYLLGITPNDFDITTNALPEQISKIFSDTFEKGKKYSSIVVNYKESQFEVTTFRNDLNYLDHRHPLIAISSSLEEDLSRRDYTINAMAMDYQGNIIDIFNGKNDLDYKIIKTVNNPLERFNEDALRMLRAFYFASKLNFTIEDNTLIAIKQSKQLIKEISLFRIRDEIRKMLNYDSLIGFRLMVETTFIAELPFLEKGINYIVNNQLRIKDEIIFYALCFLINKENFNLECFSNKEKKLINDIIYLYDKPITNMLLYKYELKSYEYICEIKKIKDENYMSFDEIVNMYSLLPIKKTKDLAITSLDIVDIKNKPTGKWVGELITLIETKVLNKELNNNKEEIIKFIERSAN